MNALRNRSVGLAAAAALIATPVLVHAPAADARPTSSRTVSTSFKERAAAARIALSKVRSPYRWGAAGPRAFDCSGLVAYAYRRAGHVLPARTSYDLHRTGRRVSRKRLRRGDLVYTWDRSLGHVGVYIGGGKYVHAPGTGRRVQVASVPPSGGGFVSAIRP